MKEYLNALNYVMENGIDKSDRTGVGIRSIFGYQMRFDLQKGFPAITTKKLAFKSVVSELLWFLEGSTDERRLAEIHYGKTRDDLIGKNTIWTANCVDKKDNIRFNGTNLGNLYGMLWSKIPALEITDYIYIPKKIYINHSYDISHPNIEYKSYYNSGKKIDTKDGVYTILGKSLKNPSLYVIQFDNTGYIKEVSKPTKHIKDRLLPSVEGKGYYGYGVFEENTIYKKIYRLWQDMIIRCYNPRINHNSYDKIEVEDRWLNFSNFYEDVFSLPNYQEFVDSNYDYQLDKDYYGSTLYCKDACIFIPSRINKVLNSGGTSNFIVYKYNNKIFFSKTNLEIFMFGKRKKLPITKLKELGVSILEDTDNHLIRPKLFINQLENVINQIKNNPDSRRMVVSAWNPENERNAVLASCHTLFQFYVSDGKLSCHLYQRSADFVLGSPFNIASYSLLTHMVAQVCNLKVGDFIYTMGDMHVYHNHFDGVYEQLRREPMPLPTLWLNPEVNDIFKFTMDDIKLLDYRSHDKIDFQMAV